MQSQNGNEIHVLALAGSFRKGSLNQALVRAARELAPGHVRIDDLDLRTVPFYDGDLEAAGDPEEVAALKTAIAGADALLIATPEYNGSVPAVLKNVIDWASRQRPDSPLSGKLAAVMGTTGGSTTWATKQTSPPCGKSTLSSPLWSGASAITDGRTPN